MATTTGRTLTSAWRRWVAILAVAAVAVDIARAPNASTRAQLADGVELHYVLTVANPSNGSATVTVTITGLEVEVFEIQEFSSVAGYRINVVSLTARSGNSDPLVVECIRGTTDTDPFGVPTVWRVRCAGLPECIVEYTFRPKLMGVGMDEWYYRDKYYWGYISSDFAAFAAEWAFLLPPRGTEIASLTVSFAVPEDWKVFCRWPQQGGVYNPLSLPFNDFYFLFGSTGIGSGRFDQYLKTIGNAEVTIAAYQEWPVDLKQALARSVWDIFAYEASVWGDSLDAPWIQVYCPYQAPDGELLAGVQAGMGQITPLLVEPSANPSWFDLASDMYCARWNSYDWGIVDNSCGWFKEGVSHFYANKTMLHTKILSSRLVEDRLRGDYD